MRRLLASELAEIAKRDHVLGENINGIGVQAWRDRRQLLQHQAAVEVDLTRAIEGEELAITERNESSPQRVARVAGLRRALEIVRGATL